jgi:hypothetical protein
MAVRRQLKFVLSLAAGIAALPLLVFSTGRIAGFLPSLQTWAASGPHAHGPWHMSAAGLLLLLALIAVALLALGSLLVGGLIAIRARSVGVLALSGAITTIAVVALIAYARTVLWVIR